MYLFFEILEVEMIVSGRNVGRDGLWNGTSKQYTANNILCKPIVPLLKRCHVLFHVLYIDDQPSKHYSNLFVMFWLLVTMRIIFLYLESVMNFAMCHFFSFFKMKFWCSSVCQCTFKRLCWSHCCVCWMWSFRYVCVRIVG